MPPCRSLPESYISLVTAFQANEDVPNLKSSHDIFCTKKESQRINIQLPLIVQ